MPTENESINWDAVTEREANVNVDLGSCVNDESHEVTFEAVRQLPEGAIVADVRCETIEGNTLWLKGRFGPQNGLLSLMKAADGGENIEGNTFVFTRIESEKSPAGYAFRWTAL